MFTRVVDIRTKTGKARDFSAILNEKVLPILRKQPDSSTNVGIEHRAGCHTHTQLLADRGGRARLQPGAISNDH